MINKYIEHLWKKALENEFQQDGRWNVPNPTCKSIYIRRSTVREVEVLALSLLYDNNLLQDFLHKINSDKFNSPMCPCGDEEQTAHHILFRCQLVNAELRAEAYFELEQAVGSDIAVEDSVTLLSASRHQPFMDKIVDIVTVLQNTLKTSIEL